MSKELETLATKALLADNPAANVAELEWLDYEVVEQPNYLPFAVVTGTLSGEKVSVHVYG